MDTHAVDLELVAARELLITVGTGVRLLPGVQANMAVPVGLLGECLAAEHAWAAVVVAEAVHLQFLEGGDLHATDGAVIGTGRNFNVHQLG